MSPSVRKPTPRTRKLELRVDYAGRQKHIGAYYPEDGAWRKGQLQHDQLLSIAGNTPGWDLGTYERLKIEHHEFTTLEFTNWDGTRLRATVLTMDRLGFIKNYHYGAQRYLDVRHWTLVPQEQWV